MIKQNRFLFLVFVLACLVSCNKLTKATDFITQPTAREVYARDFEDTNQNFKRWNTAFETAKTDLTTLNLPFSENIQLHNNNLEAYSYTLKPSEGENIHLNIKTDVDSIRFFSELFKVSEDSLKTLKSIAKNKPSENSLKLPIKENATYKLVIQPELIGSSKASIVVFTTPSYYFPVAGKDGKAIKSFWGAKRDGGKRSHEGLDIFAKRGTPVLASVDGFISSTGNRGLGGKQVWLRDGLFGASLYYAHLDTIIGKRGKRVKIGDTLGLVGNSGNAKYTPPHLHFGIYKGYSGAINPLPFVKNTVIPETDFDFPFISKKATINSRLANIRIGPSTKFEKVDQLKRNDTISVLGEIDDWFHIETPSRQKAFIYKNLTTPLEAAEPDITTTAKNSPSNL